jgi:hypothetical protein
MPAINRKLRIGILTNGPFISRWSFDMLRLLQERQIADIVLVIQKDSSPISQGFYAKLFRGNILYKTFRKLEAKFFTKASHTFDSIGVDQVNEKLEIFKVKPRETKFSDFLEGSDLETISRYDLDLCFRFGFRILRGDILSTPKYGIWSFHHGDNMLNRGGPAGLWEYLYEQPITGSTLQILTNQLDGGRVIERAYCCTDQTSFTRNISNLYNTSIELVPKNLNLLREIGGEAFFSRIQSSPEFYSQPLFQIPRDLELLPLLIKKILKISLRKIKRAFTSEQWILLLKLSKSDGIATNLFTFKTLYPGKDRLWADPFVLQRNGKYYIFFEEVIYGSKKKGTIQVISVNSQAEISEPTSALECDYHLSYPFLYEEQNGQLYMIPETKANKAIEIYECTRFPDQWSFKKALIEDIEAVDATIYKKDDIYWMFATVKSHPGGNTSDQLHLYYANDLFDEWISHPQNPIVTDVRRGRSAGNIIEHNGKIYRPAQCSVPFYGHSIKLCEIIIINKKEYLEVVCEDINPNWTSEIMGIHTYNHCNKLSVADAIAKTRHKGIR